MKLIYRCQQCGMQNTLQNFVAISPAQALDVAYAPAFDDTREFYKIVPYVPHPCDAQTLGVAQLVGVQS